LKKAVEKCRKNHEMKRFSGFLKKNCIFLKKSLILPQKKFVKAQFAVILSSRR